MAITFVNATKSRSESYNALLTTAREKRALIKLYVHLVAVCRGIFAINVDARECLGDSLCKVIDKSFSDADPCVEIPYVVPVDIIMI